MARSFDELRNQMSNQPQRRSELIAQQAMVDLLMDQVRSMLDLGGNEDRSTLHQLRRLVEGLGGELEITIRLPGGQLRVT